MEFSNIISALISLCHVGAPFASQHLLCPVSFVSTLSKIEKLHLTQILIANWH